MGGVRNMRRYVVEKSAFRYTGTVSELVRRSRVGRPGMGRRDLRKVRATQSMVLANGQAGRPDGKVPQRSILPKSAHTGWQGEGETAW